METIDTVLVTLKPSKVPLGYWPTVYLFGVIVACAFRRQ
jgi:hypothetical protein